MALKLQARPRLDSRKSRQEIPQNPGVYFFRNSAGKTLYIGKASNLRARLGSYLRAFRASPAAGKESLKLSSLLKESAEIKWEILNSEVEALIKEAELIKKYRPKYNVLMRDDKQYFYAGFSKDKFPKIFLTHQPRREAVGADYIGPFTDGGSLKSVLKTLRKTFPYCTCKSLHTKLCLNGKIGRCPGYCCLKSQRSEKIADYRANISAIKKILSGKNKTLALELKKEMALLSKTRKYEEAGKARDQIKALERIFFHRGVLKQDLPSENQKALHSLETILGIENINRIEAYDIADIGGEFAYGSMAVSEDGKTKKDDYRIFKINSVSGSNDPAMLREVLSRRFKHPEWAYPQVIIVDGGKAQMSAAKPPLNPLLGKEGRGVVKIIALTKNKKHIGDHIFIQGRANPMPLDRLPPPLKNLILHLDSEAHRFAISHYRRFHRKSLTK